MQKQEYNLESVRTLFLNSIRLIHSLINFLIGRHSMKIEDNPLFNQILYERAQGIKAQDKIKFYLHRYICGVSAILKFDSGVRTYKKIEQ
jgi:hypothetical protein